jgi:thiazolinyl reductase component of yersiniabactin synthetase
VIAVKPPDRRVGRLLQQLRSHLAGGNLPAACHSAHQLALSHLWQQILRKTGHAEIRHLTPPRHDRLPAFYRHDEESL